MESDVQDKNNDAVASASGGITLDSTANSCAEEVQLITQGRLVISVLGWHDLHAISIRNFSFISCVYTVMAQQVVCHQGVNYTCLPFSVIFTIMIVMLNIYSIKKKLFPENSRNEEIDEVM